MVQQTRGEEILVRGRPSRQFAGTWQPEKIRKPILKRWPSERCDAAISRPRPAYFAPASALRQSEALAVAPTFEILLWRQPSALFKLLGLFAAGLLPGLLQLLLIRNGAHLPGSFDLIVQTAPLAHAQGWMQTAFGLLGGAIPVFALTGLVILLLGRREVSATNLVGMMYLTAHALLCCTGLALAGMAAAGQGEIVERAAWFTGLPGMFYRSDPVQLALSVYAWQFLVMLIVPFLAALGLRHVALRKGRHGAAA